MELTVEDFIPIRDLIKERCGIWLGESKISFLRNRLVSRLKATNMDTAKEYFYFLKYDPFGQKEMDELVDAVTVNETYFNREDEQLGDFVNEVVPLLLERKRGVLPLSIWSAGCSTGEEPYTLAMLLMEHQLAIQKSMIDIFASDINNRVLCSAREGLYTDYSVRHLPPLYLLKYFEKDNNGIYSIKDEVKTMVRFACINFMDSFATSRIKEVDCIFCRNVIIYFDKKDKVRCIEHLYRSLAKGGYLLLGHSESLEHVTGRFDVVRLKKTVAYKKS